MEPNLDNKTSHIDSNTKTSHIDSNTKSSHIDSKIKSQPSSIKVEPNMKTNGMAKVKVDSDIKTKVSSFLKDFYNQNVGHDVTVSNDVVDWFQTEIQMERDRWLEKVKVALGEIESQRRISLAAKAIIERAGHQLVALLHSFDVNNDVIDEIRRKDSERALVKYVEILAEICGTIMEERFQCLEILGDEGMGSASLVSLLKETIDELVVAADNPGMREENQELKAELNNVKNILDRKQMDILSLQKQLNDINDLINEQFKVRSDMRNTDNQSHKVKADRVKEVSHQQKVKFGERRGKKLENKETRSDSGLFDVVPSSGYYKVIVDQKTTRVSSEKTSKVSDTNSVKSFTRSGPLVTDITPVVSNTDGRNERPERISSERSQALSSVYSQPTSGSLDIERGGKTNIEISEEKLQSLKIRAKKLETSLQDAITSMGKFNKKIGGEKKIPVTPSNDIQSYNSRKRLKKLKVASWQNIPFEVQGSRTDTNTSSDDKHHQESKREDDNDHYHDDDPEVKAQLSNRPTRRQGPVSKCFRCQTLFRKIDNHKMACCYHSKAKERFERYNNSGQLLRVMYLWKCCKQEIDNKGCCFGQHI